MGNCFAECNTFLPKNVVSGKSKHSNRGKFWFIWKMIYFYSVFICTMTENIVSTL